MIRQTTHFTGRVQGVGFRYTTHQIAEQYDVGGYVENLADGRVRVVAEGEADQVEGFIKAVGERMSRYIQGTSSDRSDATGEFDGFGVRH